MRAAEFVNTRGFWARWGMDGFEVTLFLIMFADGARGGGCLSVSESLVSSRVALLDV